MASARECKVEGSWDTANSSDEGVAHLVDVELLVTKQLRRIVLQDEAEGDAVAEGAAQVGGAHVVDRADGLHPAEQLRADGSVRRHRSHVQLVLAGRGLRRLLHFKRQLRRFSHAWHRDLGRQVPEDRERPLAIAIHEQVARARVAVAVGVRERGVRRLTQRPQSNLDVALLVRPRGRRKPQLTREPTVVAAQPLEHAAQDGTVPEITADRLHTEVVLVQRLLLVQQWRAQQADVLREVADVAGQKVLVELQRHLARRLD